MVAITVATMISIRPTPRSSRRRGRSARRVIAWPSRRSGRERAALPLRVVVRHRHGVVGVEGGGDVEAARVAGDVEVPLLLGVVDIDQLVRLERADVGI